jgi:hypothetical protein
LLHNGLARGEFPVMKAVGDKVQFGLIEPTAKQAARQKLRNRLEWLVDTPRSFPRAE